MTSGICSHRDKAIIALLDYLVCLLFIDGVVHHNTELVVSDLFNFLTYVQAGIDHRGLVFHAQHHVFFELFNHQPEGADDEQWRGSHRLQKVL